MKGKELNEKSLLLLGNILLLIGIIGTLIRIEYSVIPFSVGAIALVYVQIRTMMHVWKNQPDRKRLAFNGLFASLLLFVAAYFMFMERNSWVLAVLIYALSMILLSYRWGKDNK